MTKDVTTSLRDLVEKAARDLYVEGYRNGFVDRDFDGSTDEREILGEIDHMTLADGWDNAKDVFNRATGTALARALSAEGEVEKLKAALKLIEQKADYLAEGLFEEARVANATGEKAAESDLMQMHNAFTEIGNIACRSSHITEAPHG